MLIQALSWSVELKFQARSSRQPSIASKTTMQSCGAVENGLSVETFDFYPLNYQFEDLRLE